MDRKIREATVSLLREVGNAHTTMSRIAKLAGISSATLYRRFDNRNEVFLALLDDIAQDYVAPDTGSLRGDLEAFIEFYNEALSGELGRLMPAIVQAAAASTDLALRLKEDVRVPFQTALRQMFERGLQRGEVQSDVNLDLSVELVTATLHHRRLCQTDPLGPGEAKELVSLVCSAVKT